MEPERLALAQDVLIQHLKRLHYQARARLQTEFQTSYFKAVGSKMIFLFCHV